MTALLHAELLKLRTTRTFVTLTGFAVGTSVLIAFLVALLTEPTRDSVLVDVYASDTSSFFILVLAVIGISGEWRHRTITSSLLAAPDRVRFLAAKTIAFAAAGIVLSLLIAAAIGIVAFAILSFRDLPTPGFGDWIAQVGRNALVAALFGGLGVTLGALLRNQAVTIVGILLLILVVDSAVTALVPSVGRYSPFSALPTAITDIPPEDAGLPEDIDLFSPIVGLLLMLAWIGSLFAIGATLLKKRDVE